jgi:hypothetical protein
MDYQTGCAFELQGVLTAEVNDNAATISMSYSDLMMTGDVEPDEYPSLEQAPVTPDRVEQLLSDLALPLVTDDGQTQVFRERFGATVLEITLSQDLLQIKGGRDNRPVDGDGYRFEVSGGRTWYGDANLDGEFESGDLIDVFSAGVYDDQIDHNAHWWSGDWTGDGEFDSSDLIVALAEGGYEQGPLAAVSAVPEPASAVGLLAGLLLFMPRLRRRARD